MIRRRLTEPGRARVVFAAVAVCSAAAGLGVLLWPDSDGGGGPAPGATAPVRKLPVVVDSAVPGLIDAGSGRSEMGLPSMPGDDPLTERALSEIQERTLVMAGIRAGISAACEGGRVLPKAGHKTPCTVTYRGVELTWDVWVSDVAGSGAGQLYWYDIYPPDSGLLLADAVYGRFWNEHHKSAKELRCDRIPAVKTVELGADTGYACQYLDTADADTPRWVTEKVLADTTGPVFRETGQRDTSGS
ncbi:hypothetical protein [Streptomyces fumanus]|uniref:hypothetical protein n=1 Tax=Streptomyces fumanus TaxID=67302 RepID=UPI0033F16B01